MLAKKYTTTMGCPGNCTFDQFTTALDGDTAQNILIKQGASSASQPMGSNCESKWNACNLIYLAFLNTDPEQPLLLRATQSCYPPGSVYKSMTLLAALDSGALTFDYPFYQSTPIQYYAGDPTKTYPQYLQAAGDVTIGSGSDVETFYQNESNIVGYTYHFPVTFAYGFSHSDNVIFAQAGYKTGASTWLSYNHKLHVNQVIPFDLPVKVSSVAPTNTLCGNTSSTENKMTNALLAEDSFGQGKDFVTPMQMLLIQDTIANDGNLMRPTLIAKIVDAKTNTTLQDFNATSLGQMVSQKTAQLARDAEYSVVACGSGSLPDVQLRLTDTPWAVIGKTGTAQLSQ